MRAPLINKCVRAHEASFYDHERNLFIGVCSVSVHCWTDIFEASAISMRNDRIGNSPVGTLIENE